VRRRIVTAAVAAFAAAACGALPCAAQPQATASLELIRPLGDTYNERSSDGDQYPQSLGVRAGVAFGDYAVMLQYWRSVYLTESAGPGSLTRYARLEGGFGTVRPFLARDSSFEAHLERRIARVLPLYAGLGVVHTTTNYHYPQLTGAGLGLELRPSTAPGVRPFASMYYYPAASGTYVTETLPTRTMTPAFDISKIELGAVLRGARTPLYGVLGYASEVRTGRNLSNLNRFIRSDPYAGVGIKL